MTDFETEYIFCKDNRLVLIVEFLCLSSALFSGRQQLICIKAAYSKSAQNHTLEVVILTSYTNLYVGYIELKLHI